MGHISIVYGKIIGATWKTDDYHKLQRFNRNIIYDLPLNNTASPLITKEMFAVPDPDKDKIYREQVIVFGASYKDVEDNWAKWLEQFENILRQLFWTSATVHLETELFGRFTFEWTIDLTKTANWFLDVPQPILQWKFESVPRDFFSEL
ncbi:hypothetical protein [Elizabethkingia anophelis]|uniref:hypothetical protein n=1 Tax=Elizabethkingia anophelis TaxID=1117645 RepID=UPI00301C8CBA